MRQIPADLQDQVRPCPQDFTVPIREADAYLAWKGAIETSAGRIACEIGFQHDVPNARELIRQAVWQLQEFGRLNRPDLMAYARGDRVQARKGRRRKPLFKPGDAVKMPDGTVISDGQSLPKG